MAGYDAAMSDQVKVAAVRRTEAAAALEQATQAAVAAERAAMIAQATAHAERTAHVEDIPVRNELSVIPYSPPATATVAAVAAKKTIKRASPAGPGVGRAPRTPKAPKEPKASSSALPFSSHPNRLAVQNGVLSFHEGTLKFLPPDSTLAMRAGRLGPFDPIPYIPLASLQEDEQMKPLMDFLTSLFPERDVLEYVLCAVASCLDGVRRVPNLFLCHGAGSSGKSAFQTLVSLTLGDYAATLPPETLCKKTTADQFHKLVAHRRWIAVGEPDLSASLNAGSVDLLLKSLPAHVFLFTCDLPGLKADDALWSHVRVLPFEATFSTDAELVASGAAQAADLHLQSKLPLWRKVFLSLLVDRFAAATREARAEPAKVLQNTLRYRMRYDPIKQFVHDCLVPDETAPPLEAAALRQLVRQWHRAPTGSTELKESEILGRLTGTSGVRPRWTLAGDSGFILDTVSRD
jgi:phage/plasmid-associated DNA primase